MSARSIVKRPIITEKSMGSTADHKYTFEVAMEANKRDIRKAVHEIFNVTVLQVHTSRVPGKPRRHGRFVGMTSEWKKAVVTLKEGDQIQLGGVNYFEA